MASAFLEESSYVSNVFSLMVSRLIDIFAPPQE